MKPIDMKKPNTTKNITKNHYIWNPAPHRDCCNLVAGATTSSPNSGKTSSFAAALRTLPPPCQEQLDQRTCRWDIGHLLGPSAAAWALPLPRCDV